MNFFSARFTTIKDFLATQHWPTGFELKNLLHWSYYNQIPPNQSPFVLLTTVIIVLITAAIFGWWLRTRQLQKQSPVYDLLLDQLPTLLIFIVVVSIFYAFCWAQSIQYLSSPLVLLAAFILVLGWAGFLIFYTWRILPAKLQAHLEKERFFRYLPKKKKNA